VLGNQVYIDRTKLPSALVSRIARLAAFQNPEFYAAQAMRLPTFGKPRVISCAELLSKHIALPRGCLDDLLIVLRNTAISANLRDQRQQGRPIGTRFLGELTPEQEKAAAALLLHETGVLAATTAFGKTVVAAKMIAARDRNTLVLVHRRQLLDQWVARLRTFLNLPLDKLGVIHGGRQKPTGFVDMAVMQSLVRKGAVSDLVADYGHVIIDECHHLSAVGFESIAREAKARYMLGLSATVTRKDGHHPIIFMQCGPVRHRVDAKKQAALRPFDHKVVSGERISGLLETTLMKSRRSTNSTPSLLKTKRGMISSSMISCRRLRLAVRRWSLPNARIISKYWLSAYRSLRRTSSFSMVD
jgi:superfamily II DNA or RNA helicase